MQANIVDTGHGEPAEPNITCMHETRGRLQFVAFSRACGMAVDAVWMQRVDGAC